MTYGAPEYADVTAIVCDDDRVARSVVTSLIEERHGRVLAETDQAVDAIGLIERFRPTLLVIDMALQTGHGIEVVEQLRDLGVSCQVVVFTSYAEMARPVDGVSIRVVEKPDFERLESTLDAAIADVRSVRLFKDRRRPVRDISPAYVDAEGLVTLDDFYRDLADARPGDALLGIDVTGEGTSSVVRALRDAIRVQDRIALRHDTLVVLLVGGGDEGPAVVLGRLRASHPRQADTARSTVLTDADAPLDAIAAVSPL